MMIMTTTTMMMMVMILNLARMKSRMETPR